MAYGFQNLRLSGYEVEEILECKIQGNMGEHTTAYVKALLKEEAKEELIHTTSTHYPIEIYVQDKDKKISLFYGVATKVSVHFEAEVYWLYLEAKSYTYLMDITRHSRSFQDIQMTYHEVIKSIVKHYSHAECILNIPNIPIGQLLVQYEETDWQFIKRITSTFNEGVFPAVEVQGIRFYAAVADIQVPDMVIKKLNVKKDLDRYYSVKANTETPTYEVGYTIYEVEADEILYLMHKFVLNGHTFYIKKFTYELIEGLFVNHYELQIKSGLKEIEIFPMHLVGVSLGGKILAPNEDKVKVHLDIDKSQDEAKAYWFPYSTMSASNDGSGWYCMPEVGDTVRVYFPTKYTKDSVALSAVSIYDTPTGGEDRMSNPDVKYLGTVHDKEVKLAPEGIRIACNGSVAVVTVGQNGAISLYGQKNVNVTAEENIQIGVKEDLTMTALETVELACDKGARVLLDQAGNMLLQGTEVKID